MSHRYAVDRASLPPDYQERFINENDFTNEGIMHKTKPIFSAQFHPEVRTLRTYAGRQAPCRRPSPESQHLAAAPPNRSTVRICRSHRLR
jgi:GMP synthase-like glutamine amidotransferase